MSLHAEGTVLIIDESDTAQPAVVPAFFDANFDFGLSGYVHPDDTVRLVPVGNPVIDKGKYRDALDTIEEAAVDADRFTASHGAGAVVARKRHPRFLIDRKSVVKGKSGLVRVDPGGRRIIKKTK